MKKIVLVGFAVFLTFAIMVIAPVFDAGLGNELPEKEKEIEIPKEDITALGVSDFNVSPLICNSETNICIAEIEGFDAPLIIIRATKWELIDGKGIEFLKSNTELETELDKEIEKAIAKKINQNKIDESYNAILGRIKIIIVEKK